MKAVKSKYAHLLAELLENNNKIEITMSLFRIYSLCAGQRAEENMWPQEGRGERGVEKTA